MSKKLPAYINANSESVVSLDFLFLKLKGGPKSGNFGHEGRSGKIGGSTSGGGFSKLGLSEKPSLGDLQKALGKKRSERQGEIKKPPEEEKMQNNDYGLINAGSESSLGGKTESYMVHVENDGDAIVKPDVSQFGNAGAELTTYEISKALGFDSVPTTVIREEGTYKRGDGTVSKVKASSQQWVDGAKVGSDLAKSDWKNVDARSYSRMSLLDQVTGNKDRHGGNYLIKDNKVVAIDNGQALGQRIGGFKIGLLDRDFTWPPSRGGIKYHTDDIQKLKGLPNNKALEKTVKDNLGDKAWKNMVDNANDLVSSYEG